VRTALNVEKGMELLHVSLAQPASETADALDED
jgi:hypothetical protein